MNCLRIISVSACNAAQAFTARPETLKQLYLKSVGKAINTF